MIHAYPELGAPHACAQEDSSKAQQQGSSKAQHACGGCSKSCGQPEADGAVAAGGSDCTDRCGGTQCCPAVRPGEEATEPQCAAQDGDPQAAVSALPSGLHRVAVLLALLSVVYCVIEGVISVAFAALDRQFSLMVFGLDSLIEVLSAFLVLWRMMGRRIELRRERVATLVIGGLLVALFCVAVGASTAFLVRHDQPETSTAGVVIGSVSVVTMTVLWLGKRHVARRLNSSTLLSDATCSLSCALLSVVLLIGSVVYITAGDAAWWVDAAAALVLSLFFLKEGSGMIAYAVSPKFDGGADAVASEGWGRAEQDGDNGVTT